MSQALLHAHAVELLRTLRTPDAHILQAARKEGTAAPKPRKKSAKASKPQTAEAEQPSAEELFGGASDSPVSIPETAQNPRFNYIPRSKWPKGIPPVMGAHLMASGQPSPMSTSTGDMLRLVFAARHSHKL